MFEAYQDSPSSPKNEDIGERPDDIEETADQDIAVFNADSMVTNYYVYPVENKIACFNIMY